MCPWAVKRVLEAKRALGKLSMGKTSRGSLDNTLACSVLYSAVQSETAVYSVCRRVHLPSQHSKCSISFISQSGETM